MVGTVRALQINVKAISNMLNASADSGVVQHVYDGAMHIRYEYLGVMAPDRLGSENFPFIKMLQHNVSAMPHLALLTYRLALRPARPERSGKKARPRSS